MNVTLNESWLHGKYPEVNAEINTSIPYVSIDDYFWQDHEASEVIDQIFEIWGSEDCTVQEAINRYSFRYLS